MLCRLSPRKNIDKSIDGQQQQWAIDARASRFIPARQQLESIGDLFLRRVKFIFLERKPSVLSFVGRKIPISRIVCKIDRVNRSTHKMWCGFAAIGVLCPRIWIGRRLFVANGLSIGKVVAIRLWWERWASSENWNDLQTRGPFELLHPQLPIHDHPVMERNR